MAETPDAYAALVGQVALAAILDLYPEGSGGDGAVDPEGAIEGLCLAIALLAFTEGHGETSQKRDKLARECSERIAAGIRNLTRASDGGAVPAWAGPLPDKR